MWTCHMTSVTYTDDKVYLMYIRGRLYSDNHSDKPPFLNVRFKNYWLDLSLENKCSYEVSISSVAPT